MKPLFPIGILVALLFLSMSCSILAEPAAKVQPTPAGDEIATAVAATFQAGSAQTATAAASSQQTAAARPPTGTPDLIQPTATSTLAPTATLPSAPAAALPKPLSVAYIGPGNDLWLWKNNKSEQLTKVGDVAEVSLSDDGKWVAYTRTGDYIHYSLWAIRETGSEERALMDTNAFSALPRAPGAVSVAPVMFNWLPGSHTLAFTTRPIFEGPGLNMNNDLWLTNADTGEHQQLLAEGQGGKFYYSPDGKQVALVKPDSISLINADGSNRRDSVLKFPAISTYSEYNYYPMPVWLPDMTGLRVVIPPQAALEKPDEPTTIWQIPVDGSPAYQIGSVHTTPLQFPSLSKNGSKMAYTKAVGDPAENRNELHIANADGSDDMVYTTEVMSLGVNWAPDSKHFLYVTGTAEPDLNAFIGQPGSAPQPLESAKGGSEFRWIDNERFLYVVHEGTDLELRIGNLKGEIEPVTRFSSEAGHPLLFDFSQ